MATHSTITWPRRMIIRLLIRIIGMAVIGSVVRSFIRKRPGGPEAVEKLMVEVMPKLMDKAFGKLGPARRQEMLAHFRATLAGLEEKYGTGQTEELTD